MDNPILRGYAPKVQPKLYSEDKTRSAITLIACILGAIGIVVFSSCQMQPARAAEIEYSNEEIADAIYKAENSKTHPYGILAHYKHTTPRQACKNTINSALKRFAIQTKEKDFIHFLSLTYAPINCDNDNGTNKFWEKNVKFFLDKYK